MQGRSTRAVGWMNDLHKICAGVHSTELIARHARQKSVKLAGVFQGDTDTAEQEQMITTYVSIECE